MKTIALTCSVEDDSQFWRLRYTDYLFQTAKACGVAVLPLVLPYTSDPAVIDAIARRFDGYIFTGGEDVNPTRYSAEKSPACGVITPQRDTLEFGMLERLLAWKKPIFGICRGIQVLNVACGGTLWQDIPTEHPAGAPHCTKNEYGKPRHTVYPTGFLRDLVGRDTIATNSYHHQAVKDVGHGLDVCAVSHDGLIEAVVHRDNPNCFAVQWHPEMDADGVSTTLMRRFLAGV